MAPSNRYAIQFSQFLKLIKQRHAVQARSVLIQLVKEWLGTSDRNIYDPDLSATFWLFNPDRQYFSITRARCFPSKKARRENNHWESDVKDALQNPALKLGAPPPDITRDGRCNYRKSPVFYGSYQDYTCMSELNPPVGSTIVIAKFEIMRQLKILRLCSHLESMEMVPVNQSRKDDIRNISKESTEYENKSFQFHLDLWMGMPLLVTYDHPQYLARRMLVSVLRKILLCDGIEFTSSQVNGSNLVIFPDDTSCQRFPLRYVDDSAEQLWVTDRPVYAETV